MHYMNAEKTYLDKTRRELRKNVTSYVEQIWEAIPHETTAVWPLTSDL